MSASLLYHGLAFGLETGSHPSKEDAEVSLRSLAEVAIPRKVFDAILARIRHWANKARAGPATLPT